jgi:hypothetical protein
VLVFTDMYHHIWLVGIFFFYTHCYFLVAGFFSSKSGIYEVKKKKAREIHNCVNCSSGSKASSQSSFLLSLCSLMFVSHIMVRVLVVLSRRSREE